MREARYADVDGDGKDFERWRARGDPAALARVFDAQAPALLRFGVHLVGDANAAEDLVQETFLTALRQAARYDASRPIDRWLAGILVRHAQELRREARRFVPRAPPEQFDERTPFDDASSADERETIARALDRLEEPYRSAAVLNVAHGLSAAEIAHALGRSPGAVRVQLHRARELLRKSLPASIASALVALAGLGRELESARGLETVRNQVLEHAARLAPAASVSAGLLGGALFMKKLVVAVVALLVVAAIWWTQHEAEPIERTLADRALATASSVSVGGASGETKVLAAPTERERVPAASGSIASSSRIPFPVRVLDGETDGPVEGVRLSFFAPKTGPWSEVRARWPERFHVDARGNERSLDWPWFREKPTTRQRLDVDPIESFEGPLSGDVPLATAISDAAGKAVVDADPAGAFVVAEHSNYATTAMPPELTRTVNWGDGKTSPTDTFTDDALVVRLYKPRKLRGQLIDLEGRPLAQRVPLRFEGQVGSDTLPNGMRTSRSNGVWSVWTRNDGSFDLEVPASRVVPSCLDPRWCVVATAKHPVTQRSWHFTGSRDLTAEEVAWIPLRPIACVRVVSAVDDAPVTDFRMLVTELRSKWPRGLVTRIRTADGRARLLDENDFQFRAQEVGPIAVRVMADGFAPGLLECAEPMKAGELVLSLQPGECPEIVGTVALNGQPVEGVCVLATPTHPSNWDCETDRAGVAAITDSDGRFALRASPGGWVVSAAHGQRAQCLFVQHPSEAPLAFELAHDTVVEFVVRAPTGTRLQDVWAQLSSSSSVNQASQLDASGRARFGSLPAGKYLAHVRGQGLAFLATPSDTEFHLDAGSTRTVNFSAGDPDAARNARLVVDGLTTLEGWTALAWESDAVVKSVESDGIIPIDIRGRPTRIRIDAPDGTTYWFVVQYDSPEPVLRIPRGRSDVRGRILRSDGRPWGRLLIGAALTDEVGGLEHIQFTSDAEGRFHFDALPAGPHTFSISTSRQSSGLPGFDSVMFACRDGVLGAGREFVIELPSALRSADAGGRVSLRGTVRDAQGLASGRELFLVAYEDSPSGELQVVSRTTVLSDGSYSIVTVPTDRYVASCWVDGRDSTTQEFALPTDVTEVRQDLVLN